MKPLLHQMILQRTINRTLNGDTRSHSPWTGQTLRDASVSSSPRFSRLALVFFPASLSLSLRSFSFLFRSPHPLSCPRVHSSASFIWPWLPRKQTHAYITISPSSDRPKTVPSTPRGGYPASHFLLCRQNQGTQQESPRGQLPPWKPWGAERSVQAGVGGEDRSTGG